MKKTAFAVALLLMLIVSMMAGAKPASATNLPEDSWASKAMPKSNPRNLGMLKLHWLVCCLYICMYA